MTVVVFFSSMAQFDFFNPASRVQKRENFAGLSPLRLSSWPQDLAEQGKGDKSGKLSY